MRTEEINDMKAMEDIIEVLHKANVECQKHIPREDPGKLADEYIQMLLHPETLPKADDV